MASVKKGKPEYTNEPTTGVYCDRCKHWFPGKPGDRHACLAKLIKA